MCGLYGFKTTKPRKINTAITKLLAVYNMERGIQSTGLYYTHTINGFTIKDTLPADELIQNYDLEGIDHADSLLGHTRFATTGKVTVENAHPFIIGDIIGTHNGIINNHAQFGQYEVDSQVIFDLLDKSKNDYKEVLPKIDGSMAIAYIYKDKMYLSRKDNPLYVLKNDTKDTIYYSSIENSLVQVKALLGIKNSSPIELPTNKMYEIDDLLNIKEFKVKYKKDIPTYKTIHSMYGDVTYRSDSRDKNDYEGFYDDLDTNGITLDDMPTLTKSEKVFIEAVSEMDYSGCESCGNFVNSVNFYYDLDRMAIFHLGCLPKAIADNLDLYLINTKNETAEPVNKQVQS